MLNTTSLKNGTKNCVSAGNTAVLYKNTAAARPITDCQKYLAFADRPSLLRLTTFR
jgi:hypothetical protein